MEKISSTNNLFIKKLNSLKNQKNIFKYEIFLIEGKNIIEEAYKLKIIKEILIIDEEQFSDLDVKKILVNKKIIDKLSSNKTNPGHIAVCYFIKKDYVKKDFSKIIFLENVNNPNNLGSIIRSAKAFSFDAIYLLGKENVFYLNQNVIRSSQGASLDFPILNVDYDEINKWNSYSFILDKNSKNIQDLTFKNNFNEKIALIFGNESKGLTDKAINYSKESIYINISNFESLNLSNSVSIALFYFDFLLNKKNNI